MITYRLLRDLGTNVTEDLVVLLPNLLSFLKHDDPAVVKQSIASGTNLFAAVLEEMALQVFFCKTDNLSMNKSTAVTTIGCNAAVVVL